MTESTPITEGRTEETTATKPKTGVNPLTRGALAVGSTLTRPVTPTDYGLGQRVEVEGNVYIVDGIKEPEPDWIHREPVIGLRLIEGDDIPHRRMSEEVVDDLREGEAELL